MSEWSATRRTFAGIASVGLAVTAMCIVPAAANAAAPAARLADCQLSPTGGNEGSSFCRDASHAVFILREENSGNRYERSGPVRPSGAYSFARCDEFSFVYDIGVRTY